MHQIVSSLRIVFASLVQRIAGVASFAGFLALYLMTLPAAFTGGRVSMESLRFLDATMITFSIVMAALIAPTLSMMIFLLGQHRRASSSAAAGGLTVGLLTPLLCCSSLLPTLMTVLASIFPTFVGTYGWRAQWFIASYQDMLFILATLLLAAALYQNAKRVNQVKECQISGKCTPKQL